VKTRNPKTSGPPLNRYSIHPGYMRYWQLEFSLSPRDPWERRQFAHVFQARPQLEEATVPTDPDPWAPKGTRRRSDRLDAVILTQVGV
jgi:hypothetical protein